MKKSITTWLPMVAMALVVLLTGCSKEDEKNDYLYLLGIEDYYYSGGSLLGPMGYLSELDIADRFTITADTKSAADAQARTRFDAEMSKIAPAQLNASVSGGTYSLRYVLRPVEGDAQTLAERTFTNR